MRKFNYRSPRFSVDFALRMGREDALQLVRCKEISQIGMKVEFDEPMAVGMRGDMFISLDELSLRLPFLVTHSVEKCGGVKFLYQSDEQRKVITMLIACLTAPQDCTNLVLARFGDLI